MSAHLHLADFLALGVPLPSWPEARIRLVFPAGGISPRQLARCETLEPDVRASVLAYWIRAIGGLEAVERAVLHILALVAPASSDMDYAEDVAGRYRALRCGLHWRWRVRRGGVAGLSWVRALESLVSRGCGPEDIVLDAVAMAVAADRHRVYARPRLIAERTWRVQRRVLRFLAHLVELYARRVSATLVLTGRQTREIADQLRVGRDFDAVARIALPLNHAADQQRLAEVLRGSTIYGLGHELIASVVSLAAQRARIVQVGAPAGYDREPALTWEVRRRGNQYRVVR